MKNKSGTWWLIISGILLFFFLIILDYIEYLGYEMIYWEYEHNFLNGLVGVSGFLCLLLILLNVYPRYNKTRLIKIFSLLISIIILVELFVRCQIYLIWNLIYGIDNWSDHVPSYWQVRYLIWFSSCGVFIKGNYISLKNFNEKKLYNTNEIINHKSKETDIPLSCPHCKSPNVNKTVVCEWCGNQMT